MSLRFGNCVLELCHWPGRLRRVVSKTSYLMQERLKYVWMAPKALSQITQKMASGTGMPFFSDNLGQTVPLEPSIHTRRSTHYLKKF